MVSLASYPDAKGVIVVLPVITAPTLKKHMKTALSGCIKRLHQKGYPGGSD